MATSPVLTALCCFLASATNVAAKVGLCDFGFKLLNSVQRESPGENVILSPAAISASLGIVTCGAGGDNRAELRNVCFGGMEEERIHNRYDEKAKGYKLCSCLRLYSKRGSVNPSFQNSINRYYPQCFKALDFSNPDQVERSINRWVVKKSDNLIRNIVQDGDITSNTDAILVNGMYFKGLFKRAFNRSRTRERPFKSRRYSGAGAGDVQVELMSHRGFFEHVDGGEVELLSIPYKAPRKDGLELHIILPKRINGLEAYLRKATASDLRHLMDGSHLKYFREVAIPKMKFKSRVVLNDHLESLGLHKCFNPSSVWRIFQNKQTKCHLNKVFHKAHVEIDEEGTEIDEEGTEAGSGTVERQPVKFKAGILRPPKFIADHPFLFVISFQNNILFAGTFHNS